MENPEKVQTAGNTLCLPIDGGPRFLLSSYDDKALLSAFKAGTIKIK
jgi:hypothetical protein